MNTRTIFRRLAFAIPALLFGTACAEAPSNPLVVRSTPLSNVSAAVACERSWTSATDGNWSDSSRWTPAIVPTVSDVVCFAASGSYIVTGSGYARHLYLTNGANVTFEHAPGVSSAIYADSVTMQPTSRMVVRRCLTLDVETLIVTGTLELDRDPSTCDGPWGNLPYEIGSLENNGWMELDSAAIEGTRSSSSSDFVNRGIVHVRSESTINLGRGVADLLAGSISGTGPLWIVGDRSWSNELFWSGTILPSRPTPTSPALVQVRVHILNLDNDNLQGAVDAGVDVVDGSVGAQVDILLSGGETNFRWSLYNYGTITLFSNWVVTATSPYIHNYGSIRALSANPYQVLRAEALDNYGVIEVTGGLALTSATAPLHVVNDGSFLLRPGALLTLDNADFEQRPTGTVSGLLAALGPRSRVSGDGAFTSVRLDSGATITPGSSARNAGSLTFDTLVIDPGASTLIDLSDPASSPGDRVHVNGLFSVNGTLALTTDTAYTAGICGQVATPFTMAKTATVTGSFSAITGTQLDAARAWRLIPGTTTMRVAGYSPGTRLSVAPRAVAVAEGGSAAPMNACLGSQAPSADVSVTPTARFGQVSVSPSPISFTTANWALPQPFTVAAIDDARAEGPHVDSVSFALSSADPGYRGTVQPQLHVDVTDNDPGVDLALSLVSAPATAVLGGLADLRFRVTNAGPGNSTGSTFTLKPMVGLTLESNSAAVSCTQGSGVLTCTIGAVASGASLDFLLLLRATTVGTQTNTARLQGRDYDPALGDNVVAWVITIS